MPELTQEAIAQLETAREMEKAVNEILDTIAGSTVSANIPYEMPVIRTHFKESFNLLYQAITQSNHPEQF